MILVRSLQERIFKLQNGQIFANLERHDATIPKGTKSFDFFAIRKEIIEIGAYFKRGSCKSSRSKVQNFRSWLKRLFS